MRYLLIAILLVTTGCANMNQKEKTSLWILGGAVVLGSVMAASGATKKDDCAIYSGSPALQENCRIRQ